MPQPAPPSGALTGGALVSRAARLLAAAGVPDPVRDARRLLAHALGIAAARLSLVLPNAVDPGTARAFDRLISARAGRVPLSHLTGERLFWGRTFRVGPAVLDPRPETETLIAAALDTPFARVLDLGTGSGCILLTLLAERPAATGLGTDLSAEALEVAAANRAALSLRMRAGLAAGDWFDAVPEGARFDLIVSNPPYIAAAEMAALAPEVRNHEPRRALTDYADGLSGYRAIAAGAACRLAPGGRVLVEIGPTQGPAVANLFNAFGLTQVHVLRDLDGRGRIISAVSGQNASR